LNFAAMRVILDGVMPDLSAQLLRPLSSALKQLSPQPEHITLIPHGHLSLLPLHAVPDKGAGQRSTLLDEFVVTYAPSARVLAQAQKRGSRPSRRPPRLLAIGDPQPRTAEVVPLPYSRLEVEMVVPLFDGQAHVLCETDASLSIVITYLDAVSYLHFSCHAAFDPEAPLKSGLVLSDGQVLSVANLLEREQLTPARLVVLSACQTAMTDFTHLPEEVIGLPTAFLQVGALGVIGTLWAVNDASTMLLMVKFYEAHLKEGLAPAAALRKAQLWLRDVTNAELSELFAKYKLTATDRPTSTRMAYEMASEKFREHTLRDPNERPYAHPYYWAPFVFYGV
jgi:CHAT domain-containing protein